MRKKIFILVAVLLVIGGIGLAIIRFFLVWIVRVPTSSMANTIVTGDYVVATKSFAQVERGTLILYQFDPESEGFDGRRGDTDYYIGRVVGLPGETIQIRGRTVYVNGQPLQEEKVTAAEDPDSTEPLKELSVEGSGPYRVYYWKVPEEEAAFSGSNTFGIEAPFKIPEDRYFVMGDNRDNSYDSRFRGPVPKNLIWGTTTFIWYSASMETGEARDDRMFKRIR